MLSVLCYRYWFIILLTTALLGCNDKGPSKSWEIAVKGTYQASFSPDNRYLIVGSISHGGSLWRLKDKERLYNWNHQQEGKDSSNIIASALSPKGKYGFTADHLTMVLWQVSDGKAKTFWAAPAEVTDAALSPDGRFALLALANHQVVMFDVQRGGILRRLHHKDRVRSLDIDKTGKLAISGSADQTAIIWDLQAGKAKHTFQHDNEVRLVAIDPSGKQALSVSKYDKASLWDVDSGKHLADIPMGSKFSLDRGQTFSAAKFSKTGKFLLTGTADRVVELWDLRGKKPRQVMRWKLPKRDAWKPTGAAVVDLAFGPKGSYYAVAANGFLHELRR